MGVAHTTSLAEIRRPDRGDPSNSEELARTAAELAASKKAEDIVILDMRGVVDYTDFLVICTGRTPRQTKAIAAEVRGRLRKDFGVEIRRVEGDKEADWILVDALDIIVHVFTPEARDFYRLARLWRDAPQVRYEGSVDGLYSAPIPGD